MIVTQIVAAGTGMGSGPRIPERPPSGGGVPMVRALVFVAISVSLSLGVACSGTQGDEDVVEVPAADPAAVREYLAGIRLMQKAERRYQRRAMARFRKAVEIDPNLWEAHYNLGVMQRREGDLEGASGSFGRAIDIQPGASEPLLGAAEVAYAQGDRDAAASRLESLVRRDPDNLNARVALAVILRENERYGPALEQAREVLIRDPSNIRALLEIGRIYRARDQHDVSQLVLGKAMDHRRRPHTAGGDSERAGPARARSRRHAGRFHRVRARHHAGCELQARADEHGLGALACG